MFNGVKQFLRRHPNVRQALIWAIPAIIVGAILRACLLSYIPYAYWGSDSRSYFDFTYKLLVEHYISLVEKRRVLYPIFVAVVTLLPGAPLRTLAWIQHAFGILTILPVAYIVRKTFVGWHWWIVPITILYAGMPLFLWYEHELLGENLFFAMVAWAFAGWVAWAKEDSVERAKRLWWCFLIPFAAFILIKPSGRFFWPGLVLGMLYLQAWRKVNRAGIIATLALMVVTLLIGSKGQGAWLMYTANFPLTRLDTPKHAEYKAQIADKVREHRARLQHYHSEDEWAFSFLENPGKQTERPLWTALEKAKGAKPKLYMSLALEAITSDPWNFLMLGRDRLAMSANLSTFKEVRFQSHNFPKRFHDDYVHAVERLGKGYASYEAMALGLPVRGPLPPWETVEKMLAPKSESLGENIVVAWVKAYEWISDLVWFPKENDSERLVNEARPTALGWYLLLTMAAAFTPRFIRTHAVWVLAASSYLMGVFLVSQVNARYFGAAWPALIPALAIPLDLLYGWIAKRRQANPIESSGTAS